DGIRDRNVTGVQTCALPIFSYLASCALNAALVVTGVVIKRSASTNSSGSCRSKASSHCGNISSNLLINWDGIFARPSSSLNTELTHNLCDVVVKAKYI